MLETADQGCRWVVFGFNLFAIPLKVLVQVYRIQKRRNLTGTTLKLDGFEYFPSRP